MGAEASFAHLLSLATEQLDRAAPYLFPASPFYTLGVIALAVIYWVLPRPARAPLLLVVSLAHALLLSGWQLLLLLVLLLYVQDRARRARPYDAAGEGARQGPRLAWTLAVLLGIFVLLKAPLLVGAVVRRELPIFVPVAAVSPGALLLPLGFSYCLFRLIHYIVEVHRGRQAPVGRAELTRYVLFFPTYRAGPIERLGRFTPAQRPTARELNAGLLRTITGLVKKILVADLLLGTLAGPALARSGLPAPVALLLQWYVVSLLVYIDFSGYSDIAIGHARLLGYRILENFDYPYLKPDIAAFWRSWHVSLHLIIRDYFLFPLFGRATSLRKLLLGVFLAFVCSQIWHALSINFLALGAYHGLLLVLYSLHDRSRKRRGATSPPGPLGRALGALLTFQLVTAGFWLFFWGRLPWAGG